MKPIIVGGETPENILNILNSSDTKLVAAKALSKLGIPNKKSEAYRYFDIESLMQRDWEIHQVESTSDIEDSHSIIITDGKVTAMPDSVDLIVGCSSFADIYSEHFDPLYYMGHLLTRDTITIRFKSDCDIQIVHRYTKPNTLLAYRVALYVDANTHVTCYESFEGTTAKGSFVMGGYDMFVSADASLKFIKDETLFEGDYIPIYSHRFKVDKNATLNFYSYDFGNGSGLQTIEASLHQYGDIKASHLLYAKESAKRGTVSRFVHIGQNSTSNQTAKNILADRARGIFDALIKVEKSAKYTKAHQNSKAILLNDGAYMASKPQLEIYIDELEASHGSTTGQLDERQLFYLRSRGISKSEAKKMLILGFANELIDVIENEKYTQMLHSSFERAYWGSTHIECMETCHGCEDIAAKD